MALSDAVTSVVNRCKRPDKTLDAVDAINRAIALFATGNFARDLAELQVNLVATAYVQQIDTSIAFTRYRKIKYLRPTGYTKYLTWRDPSRVFHDGCESLDVWYQAGVNVNFKLSRLQPTCEVGYYQYHPVLVNDADTDWMLDQMFPAVQAYALFELFDEIGDAESSTRYEKRWQLLFKAYQNDLADGQSYA